MSGRAWHVDGGQEVGHFGGRLRASRRLPADACAELMRDGRLALLFFLGASGQCWLSRRGVIAWAAWPTWRQRGSTPARLVLRAKVVLAAAEGKLNQEIAAESRTLRKTVSPWRSRFASQRIAGIERDAPRPGRSPSIPAETVELILRKTTQKKPSAATHWSTRTMSEAGCCGWSFARS